MSSTKEGTEGNGGCGGGTKRRWFKAPAMFARDFFMGSLSICSDNGGGVSSMASGGLPLPQLPRRLSVDWAVSSEDSSCRRRRQSRAASTKDVSSPRNHGGIRVVPRSQTVGRIDEDKVCEFGDSLFARSKTYPVRKVYER